MKFTYKAEELKGTGSASNFSYATNRDSAELPRKPSARGMARWLYLALAILAVAFCASLVWTRWRDGDYSRYSENVVLFDIFVKDGKVGASGFVVKDDKSWWIYTNRHVADRVIANPSTSASRLIDGTRLSFSIQQAQIAADRDLARFPLKQCKVPGLRMAVRVPVKDEPISILGNSQAEGVVTEAKGKILGYGPTEIEHDADTAPGNSGSPVIGRDGLVIAVDSRGRAPAEDRGLLKDSRYKDNRNFAVRITDVPWLKISEVKRSDNLPPKVTATMQAGNARNLLGTETGAANVTADDIQTARNYLTPSKDEISQLLSFVITSPFVKNTPAYFQHLAKLPFVYIATNDTVNAQAYRFSEGGQEQLVYGTEFFGGASRYARLIGLAYARQVSGQKDALADFVAKMPKRMCGKCSEEDALAMMQSEGLFAVLANPTTRQKAISFSSGTIASVIAHEMGHHALGHMGFRKKISHEIERNQEREADSFASSVMSSSPYGEYLFAGTLYWHYARAIQADGETDLQDDHPLSRERFENFVRANPEKAAALGIVIK